MIERDLTVIPRTKPRVLSTFQPLSSNVVEVM
jgi:hypothetical protein